MVATGPEGGDLEGLYLSPGGNMKLVRDMATASGFSAPPLEKVPTPPSLLADTRNFPFIPPANLPGTAGDAVKPTQAPAASFAGAWP